MKHLNRFILMVTLVVLCGCSSGKSQDEKATIKMNKESGSVQNMEADGFTKGTIIESNKEGDCQFTIQADNLDAYLLDPINLDEKFMKNGEKIWVKYIATKMAPRCSNANPVQIQKMMKREK